MSCKVIGIDGPGGAGKSTLAARTARLLNDAPVIHTDDFASWENPTDWWPRLHDQVLLPLSRAQPGRYQRYDWDNHQLAEWHEVPMGEYLVLERSYRDPKRVPSVPHGEGVGRHAPR
jgi:hypothetical protein